MQSNPSPTAKRLLSLDVFRGLTIAGMILVNTPGSWSTVYSPLLHAKWHGVTPTDLVFPNFLFIVGVSVFFAFRKYDQQLTGPAVRKILLRTLMIFLVGLALNWFPFYHQSIADLRIMGVLQRIALAYGIGALLALAFDRRQRWIAAAVILLGYWVLMYYGGRGADPLSLENNLAGIVDRAIFGESHVYGGFGMPFDPEGLISTIPSVVTVLLGYQIGELIYRQQERITLVKDMMILGAIGVFLGLFWDLAFPINKALWTSSYVLYAGGIAAMVLAICIDFIDLRGWRWWSKPFQVFGLNPLFAYVLSMVLVKLANTVFRWQTSDGETTNLYSFFYRDVYLPVFRDPYLASFAFGIGFVVLCWAATYLLYRRNIVIKL
jgi:predicted acyltransferase